MLRLIALLPVAILFFISSLAVADGPADNIPDNVRRIPRLGIDVPAEKKAELEKWLAGLKKRIDEVRSLGEPRKTELLPDVEIFHKAVHDALVYQEFFDPKEIDFAKSLLQAGMARADELITTHKPSWTTETGLVVRGYVSKIDGSVQPYGLVVPESYSAKGPARYRTDVWLHGRGETLSELNFLRDRMNNPGLFTPDDTIVLHPYGRYCNAFKFAGEIDVFEAIDSVKRRYRVNEGQVAIRGFSMGGAGVWHLAVHYPDRWFAANPGAGFSETPDFLKVFQKEDLKPTWWEQKLWQLYDCPPWAANLKNLPVVAYSGELDSQKQAADIMVPALRKEGIELRHIIGPGTKHAYHPLAKQEVEARLVALESLWKKREQTELVTCTLRYNENSLIRVDALTDHWRQGRVTVRHSSSYNLLYFDADNVEQITFDLMPSDDANGVNPRDVLSVNHSPSLASNASADWEELPSRELFKQQWFSDRSFKVTVHRDGEKWQLGPLPDDGKLKKKHGLQGPIDDAFLDSFLFVRPTGKPQHELAGKWSAGELDRAVEHWRRHFRGNARVKDDSAITEQDIAAHNLVLWGDPASNAILAKIADKLPIRWTKDEIVVDDHRKYAADKHALIAIYPNPLNPSKYVVLNSSFTFRDYAYLNNARQVPMLPDWAVVDLTTPPNAVWPGHIVAADFFDERWQVKPPQPR
jgi:dienelactone hydrolase